MKRQHSPDQRLSALLSFDLSTWLVQFRKRGQPSFGGFVGDQRAAASFQRAQPTGGDFLISIGSANSVPTAELGDRERAGEEWCRRCGIVAASRNGRRVILRAIRIVRCHVQPSALGRFRWLDIDLEQEGLDLVAKRLTGARVSTLSWSN